MKQTRNKNDETQRSKNLRAKFLLLLLEHRHVSLKYETGTSALRVNLLTSAPTFFLHSRTPHLKLGETGNTGHLGGSVG